MAAVRVLPTSSGFRPMFESFRAELDEHHERRERVIKASRDLTALSKKIIFSLQRSKGFLLQRTEQDVKVIDGHWRSIRKLVDSIAPDVQGINAWRYQRQVSPGMQEYVEALAFERYLTSGDMVDLTTSGHFDNVLVDNKVTEDDYVLGLCDLTGEMMRFAVTSMATNGTLLKTYSTGRSGEENTRTILSDLRSISAHLEGLVTNSSSSAQTPLTRELLKKLEVTRESVEKVEKAAYGLAIRGRERSKRWIPSVMGPDSGTAE